MSNAIVPTTSRLYFPDATKSVDPTAGLSLNRDFVPIPEDIALARENSGSKFAARFAASEGGTPDTPIIVEGPKE